MRILEDYIKPTQNELFSLMRKVYQGKIASKRNGFVLVQGEAPIMLLAHLDTVHRERVKQICKTDNGNVLMSPQGIGGDDRCGVYALNTVYRLAPVKPWLLFLCNEEVGCLGAQKFCEEYDKGKLPEQLDDIKCLIEIDRKGKDDAVYYDCCNEDFEEYITSKGFKTQWGSCSDISFVAPAMGVAAVNLSSGYYNQHTLHEYIVRSQLDATVKRVLDIVEDSVDTAFPKYEYRECHRFGSLRGGWYDDYYYGCFLDRKTEKAVDKLVPEEIRQQYKELLDIYPMSELEDNRQAYGDEFIDLLYRSEFTYDPEAEDKLDSLIREKDRLGK